MRLVAWLGISICRRRPPPSAHESKNQFLPSFVKRAPADTAVRRPIAELVENGAVLATPLYDTGAPDGVLSISKGTPSGRSSIVVWRHSPFESVARSFTS